MAIYDPKGEIKESMLTPAYIREATMEITNARESVELAKSGLYIPTVRRISRELGQKRMEAMVKSELVMLNLALNLARPMTEPMIEMTAPLVVQHILKDDCDVTLADLRIIFDRAKSGAYGKLYGGIGSADVIGWIDDYIAEKCAEYERWHQNAYSNIDPYKRGDGGRSVRDAFHEAAVWNAQRQTQ